MKPTVNLVGNWRSGIKGNSFTLHHDHPEVFVQCQWQKGFGISLPYLIYRILLAVTFFGILVSSLCETAKDENKSSNSNARYDVTTSGDTEASSTETIFLLGKDKNKTEEPPVDTGLTYLFKWPIYLTNWGITICTAQAIVGAVLVLQKKLSDKNVNGAVMNKMPNSYKFYWALHTTACVKAVAITILYWCLVYNSAKGPPTAVGILVHGINSILMLIDLAMVAHPHRLQHFYFPVTLAFIYALFTIMYFLAGGTDRRKSSKIYPQLDWSKPLTLAIPTAVGALVLVLILHSFIYGLSVLRNYLGQKLKSPGRFYSIEGEDNRGASLGVHAFDAINTNGLDVSKGSVSAVIIMNDV